MESVDLKLIKEKYGENMMHLCRRLFPTILENPGELFRILSSNFSYSKILYDDIVNSCFDFESYINSKFKNVKEKVITNLSPQELLDKAGYVLYECKSESDIQYFKKYYAPGEELCTFKGGRLHECYVFFAVKKDVDNIKRENFINSYRQDEYGTSVISIQFTRKEPNTLSIKNRYNHTVDNPDATFSNNLENIIKGLTYSFEKTYGLNINQEDVDGYRMPYYVRAMDGKYYKYNYEMNNKYYCADNVIIDNFEVVNKYKEKEKYIIADYFVIDLQNKKVTVYDKRIKDSFPDTLEDIIDIKVENNKKNKTKIVHFTLKDDGTAKIVLDNQNRIISYENDNVRRIGHNFLIHNGTLKSLILKSVRYIGNNCLSYCERLENLQIPKVHRIGHNFLTYNFTLKEAIFPELVEVGNRFLSHNYSIEKIYFPNLIKVGDSFLELNSDLKEISFPSLVKVGNNFLIGNKSIERGYFPELVEVGNSFLEFNTSMEWGYFPKLKRVWHRFMSSNNIVKLPDFPKKIEVGEYFLDSMDRDFINKIKIKSKKR